MKRVISVLAILVAISNISFAQKLYIWCPESQEVKPRNGFLENQEVDICIFDGRTIPKNSKIECESKAVSASLIEYFSKTYPSCKLNVLTDERYYKASEKGRITIKIAIAAYQAGFGVDVTTGVGNVGGNFSYGLITKGEWNGLVNYYVQIFDLRSIDEKNYQKEISEVTSKSNVWGYKTAKACLNTSYNKANQALSYFIENTFMN